MAKRVATGLSRAIRPERVKAVVLEVLGRVREEGQLADRALSFVLRRERGLLSGERRVVAETVYEALRAEAMPEWLGTQLARELGDAEATELLAALNQRAPLTLRTNTLKGTRDALMDDLRQLGIGCTPTPFSPWGINVEAPVNLFGLAPFKAGRFEIQDEGSQLIALLCAARPGQRVVDACAGGGGKTLALAAEMHNRGELWALDSSAKRLAQLKPRARRAGAHNIRSAVLTAPPLSEGERPAEGVLAELKGSAEVVLVDAPCSGTGALRRNPDARRKLTEASVAEHTTRQRQILARMAELVRPGGLLVYATCSVLRAEDEDVVGELVGRGFSAVAPGELLGASLAARLEQSLAERLRSPGALRLWPQRHGTDGFFVAGLRRQA